MIDQIPVEVQGLAVALGCGLLIGVEREQHKLSKETDDPDSGQPAGVRTCALIALAGATAALLGPVALAIAGLFVAAISITSYINSSRAHPGLTTEVMLLYTLLIGALAIEQPVLAAGLAVVSTILLQAKDWLHRFAKQTLSENELNDALLLLASALVILPILPDADLGAFEGLNLRRLWTLVVLVMAINAAGYVAVRAFGPRLGLPLTGLAGGFVSSAATIGSMAQRSQQDPALARGCAAAGMASNISTVALLAIILVAGHQPLLTRMLPALIASFAITGIYAAAVGWHAMRQPQESTNGLGHRPFHFGHALAFAGLIGLILVGSSLLKLWFGESAVPVGAALAGLADTHAVAVSMSEMTATQSLNVEQASLAIMMAFSTNTLTKAVLAVTAGGARYSRVLLPGLGLMLAAMWVAWLLSS